MTPEEQIKALDKKIIKSSIIDAPGTMLFGLGLFAKFSDSAASLYPALGNPTVVNFMIVIGAVIMIWGGYKVISLSMEKSQLKKRHNL